MKIAVYTIALNEEKHVKRWFESAKEADLLLIADTGSTDKTKFTAKSLGIVVHEISVVPWRFDVARNASLALIPEDFDICIQLDMDETLQPGWRKIVEGAFLAGNNWPSYREVTLRDQSGKAISWFNHHRIHPRKGFIWKYPIHEIIQPTPGTEFKRDFIELEVDHIQDRSKSRRSYLSLLEIAVKEDPSDWRMRHYLNREYWYNKDWNKVLSSAYEAMEIPSSWDVERASTCMWASEASHFLNLKKLSIEWAERATSEAPNFYEAWHWRAHIAHLNGDWLSCREFSFKRLELKRQEHHLVKPEVWEWWGYDLMALSSHKLGFHEDAVRYGRMALDFLPVDERLLSNLEYYVRASDEQPSNQSEK
jgi:glycosyltransferase involved in cell wall biosynthesis